MSNPVENDAELFKKELSDLLRKIREMKKKIDELVEASKRGRA